MDGTSKRDGRISGRVGQPRKPSVGTERRMSQRQNEQSPGVLSDGANRSA